ncbi:hypothetical protein SAMN04488058_105130 [Deinococcus reticulitermitis]|uniref:Uncharacterized protein n=1 Tax=Deinococcus reticulitermitis TaxID=856736 RepID=A0A1H6X8Z5_9DEIO|nr:permease prefix domain 1-containing protein [Deinococcus reticulitermitis]SEJ25633.1 hypothetical protein SAMN04488058_105130 [Deinococcus reticulitermitis]
MTSSPATARLSAAAPALERYLRCATAGLPPATRQEVWDELEEHVCARAEQLEWQGASPAQALSRALAELGPPLRVSAGMNGVHNMPKMIALAGALLLTATTTIYALSQGQRAFEIPVLAERPPSPICVKTPPQGVRIVGQRGDQTCFEFTNPQAYRGSYISLNRLRDVVTAQGGQAQPLSAESWRITFPGGGPARIMTRVLFTQNGEPYTSATVLVQAMQGSSSPIVLQGFRTPRIEAGPVSLQLTGPGANSGEQIYQSFVMTLVNALFGTDYPQGGMGYGTVQGNAQHTVRTNLPAGEVVMLVTAESPSSEPAQVDNTGLPAGTTAPTTLSSERDYAISFAEVQPGGTVTLKANSPQLEFRKNIAALSPSTARVPALLVRVTNVPLNDLKSGILMPAEPTSDAR